MSTCIFNQSETLPVAKKAKFETFDKNNEISNIISQNSKDFNSIIDKRKIIDENKISFSDELNLISNTPLYLEDTLTFDNCYNLYFQIDEHDKTDRSFNWLINNKNYNFTFSTVEQFNKILNINLDNIKYKDNYNTIIYSTKYHWSDILYSLQYNLFSMCILIYKVDKPDVYDNMYTDYKQKFVKNSYLEKGIKIEIYFASGESFSFDNVLHKFVYENYTDNDKMDFNNLPSLYNGLKQHSTVFSV